MILGELCLIVLPQIYADCFDRSVLGTYRIVSLGTLELTLYYQDDDNLTSPPTLYNFRQRKHLCFEVPQLKLLWTVTIGLLELNLIP